MPLISHFYGILIYIYTEDGGQHHTPHFHARYAEFSGSYDLNGNRLSGDMPPKQNKLIEAWISIHEQELLASWRAWTENEDVIKIEGWR